MAAADLLAECEAAISACLKSQAYATGDGLKQERARLAELQDLRRQLLSEVQESANGGQWCSVGQIDPPQ